MKTQKGFTLIELIIVIVVLGILAVTAAPQFFNFSSDARESTVKGLQGAVNGAKDIVYGKAAIAGVEAAATDTVDGVDVVYGYPAATDTALLAATNISSADWTFVNGTGTAAAATPAEGSIGIHPAGVTVDFTQDGTTGNDNSCHVLYTEATSATTGAVVTAVTGGC